MAQPPPELRSLPDPPQDGITALSYLHDGQSLSLLASTSWDGGLRIHDTAAMKRVVSHSMDAGPLLSLATQRGSSVFTGGLDGSVRKFDIPTSSNSIIGLHSDGEMPANGEPKIACSCLSSLDELSEGTIVASAGWDSMFYIWDVRSSGKAAATLDLPGKAYSMDSVNGNLVMVATAGRRTCFIDVRMAGEGRIEADMVLDRESSLKYQTRVARFFPDASGIAVGSIEGRVAIEFLDELGVDSGGKKKYAFKCHRVSDIVYPVNAIAFHPFYGTFATGGGTTVVTWDGLNKKKLITLPAFPTSVAALAFNHDGSELAIASSYTFEDGERDHPRDEIYVRQMLDVECRPKEVK